MIVIWSERLVHDKIQSCEYVYVFNSYSFIVVYLNKYSRCFHNTRYLRNQWYVSITDNLINSDDLFITKYKFMVRNLIKRLISFDQSLKELCLEIIVTDSSLIMKYTSKL